MKAFYKQWNDEDAIAQLETVHDRRRMHACSLCKGLGVEGIGMFVVEEKRGKPRPGLPGKRLSATFAHVRCWTKRYGRDSIFRLRPTQADCITLSDVTRFGEDFAKRVFEHPRLCIGYKAPRSGQVIPPACTQKAQPKSDFCTRHGKGRA